jgi:hypothetical protein
MATTKKPGTALVPWEQAMKAAAVKQSSAEKIFGGSGVGRIQITNGFMTIDGELVEGNCLDVVVLSSVHLNEYYSSVYDPRKPTVPDCYAYGDESEEDPEATMAPSDKVENRQACDADGADVGGCEGCWANEMGSADTGRGKACKNVRRLLLATEDCLESAEALTGAEVRSLSVPVMSVRNWAKYVKDVLAEELERPYYGVVTTISVVPDPKSQFKINFAFKELINFDQPLWDAMQTKVAEAGKTAVEPYPSQADLDNNAAQKQQPMKPTGKAAQMMNKGKGAPAKPANKAAPAKTPAKKASKY